jgi:hypothetical protein
MGTFEGLREEIAPPEEGFLSERALDAFREELAADSTIDPAELIQVIRRAGETERRQLAEIERQRQQAAAERLERRRQQEAVEHLPSFAVTNPGMNSVLFGEHQSVVPADSPPLERQRSRTNSELDRAIDGAFAQPAQAEPRDEGLGRQHLEEASDDGVPNGDDERHVHPLDDPFRPGMVEVEDDDGSIRIIPASHREAEPTEHLDLDDESEGFDARTAAERDRDREEWYEDQQEVTAAAALELEYSQASDWESESEIGGIDRLSRPGFPLGGTGRDGNDVGHLESTDWNRPPVIGAEIDPVRGIDSPTGLTNAALQIYLDWEWIFDDPLPNRVSGQPEQDHDSSTPSES